MLAGFQARVFREEAPGLLFSQRGDDNLKIKTIELLTCETLGWIPPRSLQARGKSGKNAAALEGGVHALRCKAGVISFKFSYRRGDICVWTGQLGGGGVLFDGCEPF